MKLLRFILGAVLAFCAHLLMVRLAPGSGALANLFVVVLILYARSSSILPAALFGGALGWVYDALVGSLYGLNGIALTVVGAVCARVSQQVSLRQPALLAMVFAVAVAFQEVVVAALLRLLMPDPPAPDPLWVLLSTVITALLGSVIVLTLARVEANWSRRRRVRRPKVRFEGRRA